MTAPNTLPYRSTGKSSRAGKTRREATPEQKEAAAARRANFRTLFARVAALPEEKRVLMAHRLGIRTAGHGHELSPCNQIMLALQFPGVSIVGGFKQWRDNGRMVKKGEKALGIWVPIRTGDGDATGSAEISTPGASDSGDGDGDGCRFIIGNVFDISQTVDIATGEEYAGRAPLCLPEISSLLTDTAEPAALLALPAPGESSVSAAAAAECNEVAAEIPAADPAPVETARPLAHMSDSDLDLAFSNSTPGTEWRAALRAELDARYLEAKAWAAENIPTPAPAPAPVPAVRLQPDGAAAAASGDELVTRVEIMDASKAKNTGREFVVLANYHGERGTVFPSYVSARRRKDLPAAIALHQESVAAGAASICHLSSGQKTLCIRYSLF